MKDGQSLTYDSPLAQELLELVQGGRADPLRRLLADDPAVARARITRSNGTSITTLHLATDWPGFFPQGPAITTALLAAGADSNAPLLGGAHAETPLHWAASTDDVEVAKVLLGGGASFTVTGGSIAQGTPLDNAIAYGCWRVAHLLLERGASVEKLWHAAALGLITRVEELLQRPTSAEEIHDAFWQACHGGHRRTAECLLA